MFRWTILSSGLILFAAPSAIAQATARPTDPVFVRAQAMVSDGNGAAGRALIDSVLKATPQGAPLYPQALFWRASLAASAADAESDYKHIVVDYPLAPQAADALLRLAQLELARGDREGALAHLQRIPRDYPRSKSLPRASYWTARVLFEKNDVANACIANARAMAELDSTEIELRNQIQYQGQRCPAPPLVNAGTAPTSPAVTSAPATSPAVTQAAGNLPSAPATVTPSQAPTRDSMKPATQVAQTAKPAVIPGRTDTNSAVAQSTVPATRPTPPAAASDSKPSIVDPEKAPRASGEKPALKPASSAGSRYSVQVAAYNHKTDAENLAGTLKKRGYLARVDGTVAPFRVRIGRYATERDAEDALKQMKAKHMDGFVVRAPEQ